jgi:outer membrane protein assembly factor BamB
MSARPAAWCRVLLVVSALGVVSLCVAEDWPAYMHDNGRTGVSAEALSYPLQQQWVYRPAGAPDPGWASPQDVPVEGILEKPRMRYDDAFYTVISGNLLYFGSSAENKVECLDAASGRVIWSFYTGAPVRLAPAVYQGRVYFGADDGCVYCLDARTGAQVWRIAGGASDERVIGHGRMVSMWPVRTGVVLDNDTAYFAAGIFPTERLYIRAVKASDGSPVWTNDTFGDRSSGREGLSPQGYALLSKTSFLVPSGRAMPYAFRREDGGFQYQVPSGNWRTQGVMGGTYAMLEGDTLYAGSEVQVAAADAATGKTGFAWFPGKRLLVTKDTSYMLTEKAISALDRATYPEASRNVKSLETRRASISGASPRPADYKEQIAKIDEELVAARKKVEACTLFTFERDGLETMIVAGDSLLVGGDQWVGGLDRKSGKLLWEAQVEGLAKGLSVSGGRLFVSTDTGAIYGFGAGAPTVAQTAAATPQDGAQGAQDDLCQAAADTILERTGMRRGYCLVLGCPTGKLALALARDTGLQIYAVDPDPARVARARKTISDAGLYGTRITVDQAPLGKLPYPNYFAHLVVSEEAVLEGKLTAPAAEVMRVLKPCGGMLCLGQPEGAGTGVPVLGAGRLQAWATAGKLPGAKVEPGAGLWLTCTRGQLPGAANWTHQYGDPGNTAASEDTAVKCPLGVLWYGEPGPDKVPSRHLGNAAPLVVNGRCYLQGINRIMCFDAYNGFPYWEREIPGAYRVGMVRECSNLAADEKGIFVVTNDVCLRLDALTGQTVQTYAIPAQVKADNTRWGFIALANGLLYGSASKEAQFSPVLFALDPDSGALKWSYVGKRVRNNTIALDGGRVFFADDRATPQQRLEGLRSRVDELVASKGLSESAALEQLKSADVRMVVALDATSGDIVWERPLDLTDCGMHILSAMATRDVVVFCGAHSNGHYWPEFLSGEYSARRVTVLSQADGKLLWTRAIGYRIRPLVIGDMLVAEPWAFDVHTGEQKMRQNPVTGQPSIWEFERPGHHCGTVCGSPNALFFRSWSFAYYDLLKDQGTQHFSGQRPGCWINMIPASGLVVVPEASSGCTCMFSIHCTTVFQPRATEKAWGMFSDRAPTLPVKHLAINLGAPGDRTDDSGKLWLAYPRPSGRMQLKFDMQLAGLPGGGYFSSAAETCPVTGPGTPWVYASGYRGLSRCTLPLVTPADGGAVYTVRLGFAETEGAARGERVFDVKLQGKTVDAGLDVVARAGGPNRSLIREYRGITVSDNLLLELAPKVAKPEGKQLPVVCFLEVERERVLNVGVACGGATLSDANPSATLQVDLRNHTDRDFSGRLEVTAPEGFTATPAAVSVKLAREASRQEPIQLSVATKGEAATLKLRLRLVRDDGTVEAELTPGLEYMGPKERMVIQADADAYVSAGAATTNYGPAATLLVDGGNSVMGDESHNITYVHFPLNIPGTPTSVTFRIRTTPNEASESGDSGKFYLVDAPWEEGKITYKDRPAPGAEIGVLGTVGRDRWEERTLNVDLTGRTELSLVIVPTTCDGASYISREGKVPPELVVEYTPAK